MGKISSQFGRCVLRATLKIHLWTLDTTPQMGTMMWVGQTCRLPTPDRILRTLVVTSHGKMSRKQTPAKTWQSVSLSLMCRIGWSHTHVTRLESMLTTTAHLELMLPMRLELSKIRSRILWRFVLQTHMESLPRISLELPKIRSRILWRLFLQMYCP